MIKFIDLNPEIPLEGKKFVFMHPDTKAEFEKVAKEENFDVSGILIIEDEQLKPNQVMLGNSASFAPTLPKKFFATDSVDFLDRIKRDYLGWI